MSVLYKNPTSMPPPAGPYSHLVQAGNLIFLSGQAPLDPASGKIYSGTFREEAELVFASIQKALSEVGATLKDVVKVNAFLGDLKYRDEYNVLYKKYFTPPYPARTTVGSELGEIKIELEEVAYIRDE